MVERNGGSQQHFPNPETRDHLTPHPHQHNLKPPSHQAWYTPHNTEPTPTPLEDGEGQNRNNRTKNKNKTSQQDNNINVTQHITKSKEQRSPRRSAKQNKEARKAPTTATRKIKHGDTNPLQTQKTFDTSRSKTVDSQKLQRKETTTIRTIDLQHTDHIRLKVSAATFAGEPP